MNNPSQRVDELNDDGNPQAPAWVAEHAEVTRSRVEHLNLLWWRVVMAMPSEIVPHYERVIAAEAKDRTDGRGPNRDDPARRKLEFWPSEETIRKRWAIGSRRTVRDAAKTLERLGFLVVERQGRPRSNRYALAWPATDPTASPPLDDRPRCGQPTQAGGLCIRPAGWGTHQSEGPCKQHGGQVVAPGVTTDGPNGHQVPIDRSPGDLSIGQPVTTEWAPGDREGPREGPKVKDPANEPSAALSSGRGSQEIVADLLADGYEPADIEALIGHTMDARRTR